MSLFNHMCSNCKTFYKNYVSACESCGNTNSLTSSFEKIEILNSMPIVEHNSTDEELNQVLVEFNDDNLAKLMQIVPNTVDYLLEYGELSEDLVCINITAAAFDFADADYFDGERFIAKQLVATAVPV